ncbi:MAG TPA: hypothetical protein DHW64_12475 [Chitinophagaceae bacterium]|nr:hypothetical protein [Chitinophagaceae bacterium]
MTCASKFWRYKYTSSVKEACSDYTNDCLFLLVGNGSKQLSCCIKINQTDPSMLGKISSLQ